MNHPDTSMTPSSVISQSFMSWISPPITYDLCPNVTITDLENHMDFQRWLTTIKKSLALQADSSHPFHSNPYHLYSVKVESVNYWKGKLSFLSCGYDIHNEKENGEEGGESEKLPGVLFVRGGSVAILVILEAQAEPGEEGRGEEYVVLTVQPRIAAGSLGFVEIPAGMIEDTDDGSFVGTAARELEEECEFKVRRDELINLSELALRSRTSAAAARSHDCSSRTRDEEPHLEKAIFCSSGASDEFNPLFLLRKQMNKKEIYRLRGKPTGLWEENERIALKIVRLKDLWWEAARDSRALAALALYRGLKEEESI